MLFVFGLTNLKFAAQKPLAIHCGHPGGLAPERYFCGGQKTKSSD
jgi:hypothetical protein